MKNFDTGWMDCNQLSHIFIKMKLDFTCIKIDNNKDMYIKIEDVEMVKRFEDVKNFENS